MMPYYLHPQQKLLINKLSDCNKDECGAQSELSVANSLILILDDKQLNVQAHMNTNRLHSNSKCDRIRHD